MTSNQQAGLWKEMEIVCNYHVMLQNQVPRMLSGFMDEIPLCLSASVFNVKKLPELSDANLLLLISWENKTSAT